MQTNFGIFIVALLALNFFLAIRLFLNSRKTRELHEFIKDLLKGNVNRRLYLKGDGGFSLLMSDLSMVASGYEDCLKAAGDAENRLELILKSIPDGIAILDTKDRIKSLNPAFERLFHVKASSISGRGIGESVSIPGLNMMTLCNKEQQCAPQTYYLDAEDRHVDVTALPYKDPEGRPAGAVVIFRDVTAQKKIDQIRRDFVANVSHELKTPVTAIKGFSETLLDGALENREDSVKFLNSIKFQADRMDALIRDLITLSKIEFGAVPIEKKPVKVEKIAAEALALFEDRAASKGIYLKKDIQPGCEEIEADPDRLLQILVNLIDNAVKYTETGGVIVRSRKAEDGSCLLVVRDTGIGVPRKYVSRLGERFFRVDPSRSRELGGTGLGLAIVKHLVMAQGWKMTIDTDLGKGTVVRLHIPER
jgi:two-component system phosphate regulon sensor histidine kinase PhoR